MALRAMNPRWVAGAGKPPAPYDDPFQEGFCPTGSHHGHEANIDLGSGSGYQATRSTCRSSIPAWQAMATRCSWASATATHPATLATRSAQKGSRHDLLATSPLPTLDCRGHHLGYRLPAQRGARPR